MSATPSAPKKATRLLQRFELLDEWPHVTGGRLFRARDLAFAELVGVKQFNLENGLSPEGRRQLEAIVRRLQSLEHPHLVRIHVFDAGSGLLVQEWIQGISLLDLLRRRRALPVNEALRILGTLPGTLDFLTRHGLSTPRSLLGKLFIQFESPAAAENAASIPVDKWPLFNLKLNTLSIRELITTSSVDDTTNIGAATVRRSDEKSGCDAPQEFARLLYELLGGRIRELDGRRYIPVGALGEGGNVVLQKVLLGVSPADCQTFWHALLDARPEHQRVLSPLGSVTPPLLRPLRIPEPFLHRVHAAKVLTLQPTDRGIAPIRLTTHDRFNIGRSSQQADFAARIFPETESNNALTNRLSRIHTHLERVGEKLRVRDGNGNGPSLNGSYLNGELLGADSSTLLSHRSLLWLGEEYAVELIPVLENARRGPSISNLEAWSGPKCDFPDKGPYGAVVCLPMNLPPVVRQATWLFTEVGFGLNGAEHLVWDTRGRSSSPAKFHYRGGQFWLSNRSLPETALACDETPLHRDAIIPLVPGQTLRMGSHTFTVLLE